MCMTLGNTMHNTLPPFSQVSSSTCNDFRPRVVLLYMISSCLDTQKFSTVSQLFEQLWWWCDLLYHMSFFLWFKMRWKQSCVWSTKPLGVPKSVTEILQFMPTWRPHQPPNVAGILNDTWEDPWQSIRVDGQQNHCWVTHQHQRCEPTSLCWGVKVFVSPTGIAKCLMKHPRGSCRWTMEWDPEGWLRLLRNCNLHHFTLFVWLFGCLFVCLFVRWFVCLFVCLFVRSFVCLFVCLFICFFSFPSNSYKPTGYPSMIGFGSKKLSRWTSNWCSLVGGTGKNVVHVSETTCISMFQKGWLYL